MSRFFNSFVFLNFAIKLCNSLHIDPYLENIRAIQDFEAKKLFNPSEYILLEHPDSRLYFEDPLVQDESNVIEVRVAPPDGFLIKNDLMQSVSKTTLG